ncbi:hypothetical protein LINPERPRIM_LOCUS9431 [Linum perenne]
MKREIKFSGPTRTKCWKQIAWEPGPNEWITVNTDGSVLKQESKAAAGGIIRDHLGRGMVAFTMNLGCCTVTRAELRGAITGLREANKVADFLANQGHLFPFGTHLFPLSDCNLGHILRYDCLGISEPRFILIDN